MTLVPVFAAAFLALWGTLPAHATLIGTSVDATLSSPGDGLSLTDTVLVGADPEIAPGDGSNIGGVMLSTEFIDLDASQITIRLEEGEPGGATGYASGARYILSSLFMNEIIDDVMVTLTNLSLGAGSVSFGARSIEIPIDTVEIGEITGIDFGTITLDVTTVVPEPGTGLLLLGGLVALSTRRHWR